VMGLGAALKTVGVRVEDCNDGNSLLTSDKMMLHRN